MRNKTNSNVTSHQNLFLSNSEPRPLLLLIDRLASDWWTSSAQVKVQVGSCFTDSHRHGNHSAGLTFDLREQSALTSSLNCPIRGQLLLWGACLCPGVIFSGWTLPTARPIKSLELFLIHSFRRRWRTRHCVRLTFTQQQHFLTRWWVKRKDSISSAKNLISPITLEMMLQTSDSLFTDPVTQQHQTPLTNVVILRVVELKQTL